MILHMVPLAEARDRMTEYFEAGVCRDDWDKPTPWGGYYIGASNQDFVSPRCASMSFGGAFSKPIPQLSYAAFHTQFNQVPDPAVITYPVIHSILRALISIWKPDQGFASSSDLGKFNVRLGGMFDVSWMTYLSPALAQQITPPSTILVERDPDGGMLLIAAQETFDIANPAHLAGAYAIRDATKKLNPPPPPPWRPDVKRSNS